VANRNTVSLSNVIFDDIDKNPYLNELYENILYNYSLRLFQIKSEYKPVNISDALRFADILSKSPADSHKDRRTIKNYNSCDCKVPSKEKQGNYC